MNIFEGPKLKNINNSNDSKTLNGNNMLFFKCYEVFA